MQPVIKEYDGTRIMDKYTSPNNEGYAKQVS